MSIKSTMSDRTNISKRREYDILKLSLSNFKIKKGDDWNEYYVDFQAPIGSIYEGGKYKIRLTIPSDYPIKSPSVGFITKIFHPNVEEASGSVCLDVINKNWSAIYDLNIIFETFLPQLLEYPNPSDPLNHQAASLYLNNFQRFKDYIRSSIENQTDDNEEENLTNSQEYIAKNDDNLFPEGYWDDFNNYDHSSNLNLKKYLLRIQNGQEPFSDSDEYPSYERRHFWRLNTYK